MALRLRLSFSFTLYRAICLQFLSLFILLYFSSLVFYILSLSLRVERLLAAEHYAQIVREMYAPPVSLLSPPPVTTLFCIYCSVLRKDAERLSYHRKMFFLSPVRDLSVFSSRIPLSCDPRFSDSEPRFSTYSSRTLSLSPTL